MKKCACLILIILFLSFCILSMAAYALAKGEETVDKGAKESTQKSEQKIEDVDLEVSEVTIPARIYLNKKVTIPIVIANNSQEDIEGCTLTVDAADGSKISQTFLFAKDSRQKVELKWVPLKAGKIEFRVTLAGPKNIQESNAKNNQFIKEIDVIAPASKAK